MTSPKEDQQPMTTREELVGNLPLQYFDGPDYCTVKDATGGNFALTVQPDLMKLMEDALASRQEVSVTVEELAAKLCEFRGFGYYTDPMEGGQDAYDISCEAEREARALLAKYTITKRTTEG